MFPKNPVYVGMLLSMPALWFSALLAGIDNSEQLSAFEDWFLVANIIFTVSAAAFAVIGLIRLIED